MASLTSSAETWSARGAAGVAVGEEEDDDDDEEEEALSRSTISKSSDAAATNEGGGAGFALRARHSAVAPLPPATAAVKVLERALPTREATFCIVERFGGFDTRKGCE